MTTSLYSTAQQINFSCILRKKAATGNYGLYIRIHYLKMVCEMFTEIYLDSADEFDNTLRRPIDSSKNKIYQTILSDLMHMGDQLQRAGLLQRPQQIKKALKEGRLAGIEFLATWNHFMEHLTREVEADNLAQGTFKNYFTTERYLIRFVKETYKQKDIPITLFNRSFVDRFNHWLTKNTQSSNNGRYKHFERLKRFVKVMTDHEYMEHNPFKGFTLKKMEVRRMYLDQGELEAIRNLKGLKKGEDITRDMFLFLCNTGLSYSDLDTLTEDQIEIVNGIKVIKGMRQKTKQSFMVPLSNEALALLDKHANSYTARRRKKYLPVYCNQNFNRRLKILAKKANIDKTLSSHVARHTFATLALTRGVPAITIQKVLGHADQRMTQRYARLIDTKLIDDMKAFSALDEVNDKSEPVEAVETTSNSSTQKNTVEKQLNTTDNDTSTYTPILKVI